MNNFPTVISADELSDMFANSQVETTHSGGAAFLKMDFRTGVWTLGKDSEDVTGMEIHVNSATLMHGWILWVSNRPTKNMVKINEVLPMRMASVGADEPKEARAFEGSMVDDLTHIQFDGSSKGVRKGVDALLVAIIHRSSIEDSVFIFPQVKLTSEDYVSAQRGGKLTYNPVFEVVSWFDKDMNEDPGNIPAVEDKTEAVKTENKPERQRRKG
jgi:hypothetical protein